MFQVMIHKKRLFIVSMAVLLCLGLLFGCSKPANQPTQEQTQSQQENGQTDSGTTNPDGSVPNPSPDSNDSSQTPSDGSAQPPTQPQKNNNSGNSTQNNQSNASPEPEQPKAPSGPVVLTISGNGVDNPLRLSLEELQGLGGYIEAKYSTTNNWPTKKYAVGKGIDLVYLLEQAGIKSSAATITIKASDGYYATFTKDQLLSARYCYPNWQSNATSGAVKVPAMIAWAHKEGASDLAKASSAELRLMIGQQSVNEPNTIASVQKVSSIEITTNHPGQWSNPEVAPVAGNIEAGTSVELFHASLDKVKIHYTLDGSEPNQHSAVYNPSTTYYQPDLIKPIIIDKNTVIKAFVSGYGKADSAVSTFTFNVQ